MVDITVAAAESLIRSIVKNETFCQQLEALLCQGTVTAMPDVKPEEIRFFYQSWLRATNAPELMITGIATRSPERVSTAEWQAQLIASLRVCVWPKHRLISPSVRVGFITVLLGQSDVSTSQSDC
ncbi:MAG TPA: hypothetical protein VNG90_01735 [Candidatus Acidoferrum sp.]|nr:hypothetical protein [Candidatus Acidoferrum sp.]